MPLLRGAGDHRSGGGAGPPNNFLGCGLSACLSRALATTWSGEGRGPRPIFASLRGACPPGPLLGYPPTQSQPPPPGAPAPRVLFGVPPHPIPTSTPRGACPPGSFPAPSHPWEGDDRGVARPLGGVAHHGSPSPTPPMPGHLDVVEGLKPSRANLPLADPRGGVTKSPALLSSVRLLTFVFSFYVVCLLLSSDCGV